MIAIIANPIAHKYDSSALKKIKLLLEKNGRDVDIFFTQKAQDGTKITEKIASKYSIIAAYGGDGIINEIINADLGQSALGILPAGTTNVLAIDLKISLNPIKAALLLVNPNFMKAYAGKINGKKFLLMAGVGFDAESVANVNWTLKRIGGKLSYLISGITSYLKSRNNVISIRINDEQYEARWVIISKAKKYAGCFNISTRTDIDKPLFDVCIFKPLINNFIDLPIANFMLFSSLHLFKQPFVKHIITKETIKTDKSPVQIDGDFFDVTEAAIDLCKNPIKVVVP